MADLQNHNCPYQSYLIAGRHFQQRHEEFVDSVNKIEALTTYDSHLATSLDLYKQLQYAMLLAAVKHSRSADIRAGVANAVGSGAASQWVEMSRSNLSQDVREIEQNVQTALEGVWDLVVAGLSKSKGRAVQQRIQLRYLTNEVEMTDFNAVVDEVVGTGELGWLKSAGRCVKAGALLATLAVATWAVVDDQANWSVQAAKQFVPLVGAILATEATEAALTAVGAAIGVVDAASVAAGVVTAGITILVGVAVSVALALLMDLVFGNPGESNAIRLAMPMRARICVPLERQLQATLMRPLLPPAE